ncbi:MAG: aryl-sulfate sulfotransferase, partial [Chitinophagales bacterium]
NTHPSPGNIFFDCRPQGLALITQNSLNVIDNNGDSLFQRVYSSVIYDFQLGANGYFDTYRSDLGHFDVMDSNFNSVNSYSVTNGFKGDQHELTMLSNGYAFFTGVEDQPVNDTSDAVIEGSVIQEFDPDHNIIFEWRSFDHVDISEASHLDPQAVVLDCIHTNSIDVDTDGNIIVSHRSLDQINKIDVNTGDFIWRLGGVKNEFTFINDTAKFTFQHDCRRIANGDITLYDDGNYHSPPRSYAKEYRLDEVNKTATLVWSYTHPDVNGVIPFYSAMGSVERLPNGNTFINWGQRTKTSLPSMTEVDSNGNIVWEMALNTDNKLIAYRAHKYLWNPCARPSSDSMKENEINDQSEILYWLPVANHSQQYEVQYKGHEDSLWIDKKVNAFSCNAIVNDLTPGSMYDWRVRTWCDTVSGAASSYTDVKTFTTSGQNPANEYFFTLYPNPTKDEMLIDCNCHISQIRIVNLLGQEVKNVSFSSDANTQSISISVSNLPSGNYFVEVTSNVKREVRMIAVMSR